MSYLESYANKNNWYALVLSILKGYPVEKSLKLTNVHPCGTKKPNKKPHNMAS